MVAQTADQIKSSTLEWLNGTPFASTSLEPLSGGTANFVYRAHLAKPLDDGTTYVLVKHGEGYVANSPDFQLTTSRCTVEEECLKALASFAVTEKPGATNRFYYNVRTPKCYRFHQESNTQIQEYLPNGMDLKTYALKNYPSPTPEALQSQCRELGKALGRWLREFHDWTAQRPALTTEVVKNKEIQAMKHMINFEWLLRRVDQYPSILSEARGVFEQIKKMAAEELQDESKLQVIHGDFWSGNILLPDAPIQEGVKTPLFVIDWELSQIGKPNLDLGQMIAELYELWLYKKIAAGLWIIQGFAEGYGKLSEDFAMRTLIQVGCHLVCFGTSVQGWGTPEQIQEVARTGRDIIVNGWQKNRAWFENGELASLFSQVE